MICDKCKICYNFHVSEIGCFGSNKPCEYYQSDNSWEDAEWRKFWGVDEYDPYDPFEGEE